MKELVSQGDVRRPTEMPRISVRYRVSGTTLEWTPVTKRGLLPARPRSVEAELLDLSVVGGLIKAPENDQVHVGMRIPISIGDEEGTVEVRNIRSAGDGINSLYGVAFHEISPTLRQAVYEAIARLRDDARLKKDWDRRS